MHCPKCAIDINDDFPQCPKCGFSINDLDMVLGVPAPRNGLVNDFAKALGTGIPRLHERLQTFKDRTGYDFFVVTIETSAPRLPSERVFWLFNRWKVGGENHSGILILLSMQERRIEVEIGFELERFVSDEAAGLILQRHAVTFLKRGELDQGLFYSADVLAGLVEWLVQEEKQQ